MAKTSCPAADVARRYAEAVRIGHLFEDLAQKSEHGSLEYDVYRDACDKSKIYDVIVDLRAEASLVTASSMEGALFQVAILADLVDDLVQYTDDDHSAEDKSAGPSRSWRIRNLERRIDRMLWSIRGVLEKQSGLSLSDFGIDDFMPRYLAPSRTAKEILDDAKDFIKYKKGEPNKRGRMLTDARS